jgi:hypothetical protein
MTYATKADNVYLLDTEMFGFKLLDELAPSLARAFATYHRQSV